MPHFLIEPETWVAVAFVIFVLLVRKPAMAALAAMLDERVAKARKDLDDAAKLRAEAQGLLDEYKRKHQEAIKTADDIIKAARDDAARIARQAEADLAASLKRREQTAMDRIAQAERQALAEVRGAAVDLAVAATQRLVASHATGPAGAALIDQSIRDLPGRLN